MVSHRGAVPGLVGTILQTFLSVVATYNTLVVVSFIAAGVFAAAFARELGVTPRAATLAGAIYAFSPVVVGHLYAGHFELLWTFWIPATVLAFVRLVARPEDHGWIRGAILGMMVAAAAYTCNYYAVYAIEAIAVTAAVRWRQVLQARVAGLCWPRSHDRRHCANGAAVRARRARAWQRNRRACGFS